MNRNWSIEETVIRAQSAIAVVAQRVWDGLAVVERVTRPPRLGHDVDVVDGAERLAEREAEEEVSEPAPPYRLAEWELELLATARPTSELLHDGATAIAWWLDGQPVPGHPLRTRDYWRLAEIELRQRATDLDVETAYCEAHDIDDTCWSDENKADYDGDGPNPYEPGLTDSELVGVRGLLQERYNPTFSPAAGARAAGTSGEAVSDPPSPASPCSDPSRDRFPRETVGSRGEGSPADSGIRTSPAGEQPELDWAGWALPAVLEVLSEHVFRWADHSSIGSNAHCGCGFRPRDLFAWHDHVAPAIASRLACDPARAIAALHNHKPQ